MFEIYPYFSDTNKTLSELKYLTDWPLMNWSFFKTESNQMTMVRNDKGVSIDMPGVKKEDLDVELEDGAIKIVCNKKGRNYNWVLSVPNNVNTSAIKLKLEDGVLTVELPKIEKTNKKLVIE